MAKAAKKPKAELQVPKTREEADEMLRAFGTAMRERARIETDLEEQIAQLKADAELEAAEHGKTIKDSVKGLLKWATANRRELTEGGETKTVMLGNGSLSWRSQPAKVTISGGDEAMVATLKKMRLRRFLRIKSEVNKEAMLANPDLARTVPGVTIGSAGEKFAVKPIDCELEEVTNAIKV